MDLYRLDMQMKAVSGQTSSGYYYWTNVYHGLADDLDSYDLLIDNVLLSALRCHCEGVYSDWLKVTNVTTNTVTRDLALIPQTSSYWGPVVAPLINTLYARLYAGGKVVGFKRIRMPVPSSKYVNGILTEDFKTEYHGHGLIVHPTSGMCNSQGVRLDSWDLAPRVYGWQLRHGTKRVSRRRLQ